ncbi:MAG: hypothetical protein SF123_25225 [Chloroflexota bacterium]|nr:hypothetical protein [Chloroflexota bacterium]
MINTRKAPIVWLGAALLLLLYVLRLPALDRFPLFIDETVHLFAAEGVLRESSPLFQVWLGRQFTIWWYALFGAPLAAPAFVARFATLLAVIIGGAALLALARRYGGVWGMMLTGMLYAFSAYHMVFERLALADNIAGAGLLLAVWFAARLQDRTRLSDAVWVGVLLFMAFGAKVSALPYFGIPLAAAVARVYLSPQTSHSTASRTTLFWREDRAEVLRWLAVALGTGILLSVVYIGIVRLRGMDVLTNSFSYAINARGTADSETIFSLERILGNIGLTFTSIAPYWGYMGLVLLLIAVVALLVRKQFYLPLLIFAPLLPVWFSVIQETRFLVTALALLLLAGGVAVGQTLPRFERPRRVLALVAIGGLAIYLWLLVAPALYNNPNLLELPERDRAQYMLSDASGFNLRESAGFVAAQGDVVQVIGALPNCQSLRYMTLGSLPVTCPQVSPNPVTGDALLDLLNSSHEPGTYLILERNPYIPQNVPGTLLTTIDTPIAGRPALAIYALAP